MGEVWRARDPRLNRDVAIKTSRAEFSGRFQKEAQAIAALNHPNICTLYDVGPDYLVMEFIEGPTLAERIKEGPIPLEEALGIAKQIADALEAAHDKAIIHRDLKPANIKIRPDGSVKVLDFGLAKAGEPQDVTGDSPTMVNIGTQTGMILGTAGYMSPEQARGQTVDKRADIWAFGVVLYEMLTAKRLFDGETVSDSLAAILTKEPNLAAAPEKVRRLLAACLEKDPRRRLRDIGDWSRQLDQAAQSAAARVPKLSWPLIAVSAFAVAAIAMGAWLWSQRAELQPELRIELVTPPAPHNDTGRRSLALSPDGRKIIYSAIDKGVLKLWMRPFDSTVAQPLAGTENGVTPCWSPDGRSLGFWQNSAIKRIDIGTGGIKTLVNNVDAGVGCDWNKQGVLLFANARAGSLYRVPASGGETVRVTRLTDGHVTHRAPQFLPDGKHFIFRASGGKSGIYFGSLDGAAPKLLTLANSPGQYLPSPASGWLVWIQENALVARRLDSGRGVLTGETVTLVESANLIVAFSVSAAGPVAWRVQEGTESGTTELAWFGPAGQPLGRITDGVSFPEISPDGRRVAGFRGSVGRTDVWITDGTRATRLTFDARDTFPVWSPDGLRLAFRSPRTGQGDIYAKPVDGSAPEQLLLTSADDKIPNSWSPDGRFLLYESSVNGGDLMLLPLNGGGKPYAFVSTRFRERSGVFSPDGKWVAYQSNESGRDEIYVRPFPGPGGLSRISTTGGIWPRWRRDGKELYYLSSVENKNLMAVAITLQGGSVTAGEPKLLFNLAADIFSSARPLYDVARDGRFLVNLGPAIETENEPVHLLLNRRPPK